MPEQRLSILSNQTRKPRMPCRVEQVLSGDYLILMVDLGIDDLFKRVRARLRGVDTPDGYRSTEGSPGAQVREEVKSICASGECEVELHHHWQNKWFVTLYVRDATDKNKPPLDLNRYLMKQGFVFRSDRNPRPQSKAHHGAYSSTPEKSSSGLDETAGKKAKVVDPEVTA